MGLQLRTLFTKAATMESFWMRSTRARTTTVAAISYVNPSCASDGEPCDRPGCVSGTVAVPADGLALDGRQHRSDTVFGET
jgi:hypothetical protein